MKQMTFAGWSSSSPTTLMQFVGPPSHLQVVPKLLCYMSGQTSPLKMLNVILHCWAAPSV